MFGRITAILNNNTNDIANSPMAAIMVEYFENTVKENMLLLQELKHGFGENN